MKQRILNNLKNVIGQRTNEKLVVFSVDDYGNVCQNSATARDALRRAGVPLVKRFDRIDALETRQDLEALFDVLSSVADRCGNSAVITAYALCANIDFTAMRAASGGRKYIYETLPVTYERLSAEQAGAYEGAWSLWQEGVSAGLLKPQFHGREHLNVELVERKLAANDKTLMINLSNQSLVAIGDEPSMPGVGFSHAYGVWDKAELSRHKEIISDGLRIFEDVFGYHSVTFTPPAQKLHPDLFTYVESLGVLGIDKPLRCIRRLDTDKQVVELNCLGRRRGQDHVSIVRNVVFEPTNDSAVDSVELALGQIATAFRWRKPAIISSHRVNFSGHIDAENRKLGLDALRLLLQEIVRRWPDVRFIGADELVENLGSTA